MHSIVNYLRRLVAAPAADLVSDGELLGRFIDQHDPAAFESLVRAHGPMVWGVCLRVLRDPHTAEDAFQATFMVLVKKANAVHPRNLLGHWLHGVAYRTALKAKSLATRRQAKERQAAQMSQQNAAHENRELLPPLVDEELQRLPGKYRVPIVLCDLEGCDQESVARRLGVPQSTVRSRIARGRDLLRNRLARRGCVLSAAALAAGVAPTPAAAAVPPALIGSTVQAGLALAAGEAAPAAGVAALTHEVLRGFFWHRVKVAAAVLVCLGTVGLGAEVAARALLPAKPVAHAGGTEPPAPGVEVAPPAPSPTQPDAPTPGPTLANSQLRAVDVLKRTVSIYHRRENGPTFDGVVRVLPEAEVVIDGKPASLADLQAGWAGAVQLTAGQDAVLAITVVGPVISAPVKSVAERTITVTLPAREGRPEMDKSYLVAPDATVLIQGAPGQLAEIREGMRVQLQLSADQTRVLRVTFGTKKEGAP